MKNNKIILVLTSLLTAHCLLLTVVYADVHVSTSCSITDVQNAVNAASAGDTVSVPAGASTWSTYVDITKPISLMGAGTNYTVLTGTGTLINGLFYFHNITSTLTVRISGFYFELTDMTHYNALSVGNGASGNISLNNLRVDHNTFDKGGCPLNIAGSKGVVDHNYFYNANLTICYTAGSDAQANASWETSAMVAGTADALFIEDNYFIDDNNMAPKQDERIGTMHGGKLVVRYNHWDSTAFTRKDEGNAYITINPFMSHGSAIDYYGGPSPGNVNHYFRRGQSIIEIYNNNIAGCRIDNAICCRGSSNLIHDNIITTTQGSSEIKLIEEEGWSNTVWTVLRSSWPGEDQVHNTFIWNNKINGIDVTDSKIYISNSDKPFIKKDRDYFLHEPQATGGKEYWIGRNGAAGSYPTDGTLYPYTGTMLFQATGPNAHYPYTPYIYPHPLTVEPDTSPPVNIAYVHDGTGADISFTYSTTSLSANWSASSDPDSGISSYKYAISTSAVHSSWLVDWTDVGNNTSVARTGLVLTFGVTYYFSVKALNGTGVEGNVANSDGQVVLQVPPVDLTPPGTPPIVRDGTGEDINATFSTAQLSANWDDATDPESGIAKYYYAIGTSPNGTDVLDWTDNGTATAVTKTGLSLSLLGSYYFSVKAQNGYGLQGGVTTSDGQIVLDQPDTTPPSNIGQVDDGLAVDVSFTHSTTTLSGNWLPSSDGESGIAKYWYAISSDIVHSSKFIDWTDNGKNTSVTRTGLSLTIGVTYYFIVKSENGVGLQSAAANSNGQYVVIIDTSDTTPPASVVVVRDGTGDVDISSTNSKTQLSARWNESHDDESGVEKYYYCIGTSAGSSNVVGWTDVGLALSVTKTGLSLSLGTTYYFSVKAENGVSMQSAAADSDGQFVVTISTGTTPPIIPPPLPADTRVYPNPHSFGSGTPITFAINNNAGGTVKIFTISGKLIRKLEIPAGTNKADWDGLNEDNEKVVRGIYIYRVTGTNGDIATGKLGIAR